MRRAAFGIGGALAALGPSVAMWGFTVDDALISVRYAQNVAGGDGWRFDAFGPPTDGVTPLPWIPILAPLASGDPLDVLVRAKLLGIAAWTLAGALLGVALARRAKERSVVAATALALVALAFPIGAWAASGMETGVVLALATSAAIAVDERPRLAAVLAGLAAAFRPELLPWALIIGAGARRSPADAALAFAPFAACVAIRLLAFGHPAPLAVHAKPSDLSHGITYAAASLVVLLVPFVVLGRAVLRARSRLLVVACVVHALAITATGGDWMPYARLFVPVVPSLAIVFVDVALATPLVAFARAAIAGVVGVLLAAKAAPAGRHVQRDRDALVRAARPILANAKVVAALDVGWLSAAVPRTSRIVDLAGLTDETIALLPGGHTSKRLDAAMLAERHVDTVVLYSDARVVEQRLLRSAFFTDRFAKTESVALGERGAHYDVWVAR